MQASDYKAFDKLEEKQQDEELARILKTYAPANDAEDEILIKQTAQQVARWAPNDIRLICEAKATLGRSFTRRVRSQAIVSKLDRHPNYPNDFLRVADGINTLIGALSNNNNVFYVALSKRYEKIVAGEENPVAAQAQTAAVPVADNAQANAQDDEASGWQQVEDTANAGDNNFSAVTAAGQGAAAEPVIRKNYRHFLTLTTEEEQNERLAEILNNRNYAWIEDEHINLADGTSWAADDIDVICGLKNKLGNAFKDRFNDPLILKLRGHTINSNGGREHHIEAEINELINALINDESGLSKSLTELYAALQTEQRVIDLVTDFTALTATEAPPSAANPHRTTPRPFLDNPPQAASTPAAAVPASTTRANEEIKYISYDNFCSLEPAKQKQTLAAISDRCFNKPVTEWHEKDVDVIGGLREDNTSFQFQTLLSDPDLGEKAATLRDRLTSSKTSEPLTLRYRATILASYLNKTAPRASVTNDNNISSSDSSREAALLKEKVIKILSNLPSASSPQEILGSTEFNNRFKGDSTAISRCIDSLLYEVQTIRQLIAIFDKNYIVWNDKRKDGARWEFTSVRNWEPHHVVLLSQLLDSQDNLRELLEAAKQEKYRDGTFPPAVAVLIDNLLATPLRILSQDIKEQAARLQKQQQQQSATGATSTASLNDDDDGMVPGGHRASAPPLQKTTNGRGTFEAAGSATSSVPYSPSRPPNDGWGGTVSRGSGESASTGAANNNNNSASSHHADGSAGGVNYAAFHGLNESQKNRVLANILNKYTDESAFAPATEWHPNDIDVFFGFMRALNGPTNLNRRLLDNLEIRGLYRKRDGYTAFEILTLIAQLTQQVDDPLFVALLRRYNLQRLVAILLLNETTGVWYDDDVKFIEELRQAGALDVILGSSELHRRLSANETREIPAKMVQLIGDLCDTTSVLSKYLAERYRELLAQNNSSRSSTPASGPSGVYAGVVQRPSDRRELEIADDEDAVTDNCLTKGAKAVGSTLKSGCTKFLMWNHSGKAAIAFGVPALAAGYAGALTQFAAPWVAANATWLTTAGTTLSKFLPEAVAAFGLAHAVPPAILAFYALGALLAVAAAVFLIAFIYKKCTEQKAIVYTAVNATDRDFDF